MDTVDKETRSRIMSKVGQKNTTPETLLRRSLHKAGLRYRLYDKKLPGTPDLVFPRFRAVIFVHGCFWHSHGCYRSTVPKSRRKFWEQKFHTNLARDKRNITWLQAHKWRVMVVWECALVGRNALPSSEVTQLVYTWLIGAEDFEQVPGRPKI